MGGACSVYGVRGEVHTGFCLGNLRERDRLGDPGIDGNIILRWTFRKWDVRVWTASFSTRTLLHGVSKTVSNSQHKHYRQST
jgi:hypothetical protein